jgi:hypothetical protein
MDLLFQWNRDYIEKADLDILFIFGGKIHTIFNLTILFTKILKLSFRMLNSVHPLSLDKSLGGNRNGVVCIS